MEGALEFGYRYPRFLTNFPFLIQSEPGSSFKEARCLEISEFGLSARLLDNLVPGATATILLTLPGDSTTFRIRARVTNKRFPCYGFAFVFSSAEERRRIRQYFSTHASRAL